MRGLARATVVALLSCTPFSEQLDSVEGGVDGAAALDAGDSGDAGTDAPESCFALDLDGINGRVQVPASTDFNPQGPSTIEAWIRPTRTDKSEMHVVSHHDHTPNLGFMLMVLGSSTPVPPVLGGSARYYDGNMQNQVGFGAGSLVERNMWTHVAVTFDSTSLRLHVDGVLKDKEPLTNLQAAYNGPLRIGSAAYANGFYFGGQIDEVRISSKARYATDAMVPVPDAKFMSDADTIALWHFDEGSGTEALDASGKRHHGLLQGGAKFVPAPCGKH